jgi:hypothetical protein
VASTADPPLRECRTCGNVERNIHYRCTNCGRDYAAPPPRFSRRSKVTAAIVAGVLVLVGLGVAIPLLLTSKSEHETEQAAADRAAAVREAARLRVAERPVVGRLAVARDAAGAPAAARLKARGGQVVALQAAITRDARGRVADGRLKGPIRETLCSNIERGMRQGDERNLAFRIGRYDCVAALDAVIKNGRVVGHLGYDYFGALDFATGAYVFCQANPNESEAGRALAVALLPRDCLNTHGQRLKGGFISDPRDTRQPLPRLAAAG